jgi:hypothetical protein
MRMTGLGLLQQLLGLIVRLTAEKCGTDQALGAEALLRRIGQESERVHEAVAWFGTENTTKGHENMAAPALYAEGVNRLRRLFAKMPGKPAPNPSSFHRDAMSIAEAIAAYSLNIPVISRLWENPLEGLRLVKADLGKGENSPWPRFKSLCSQLTAFLTRIF